MEREYEFNGLKYVVFKGDNNLFDYEVINSLMTDYFKNYDYILIDEAYNKLRLKGFCDKNNKIFRNNNDISTLEDYIENYCAYKCKWLLLKKTK